MRAIFFNPSNVEVNVFRCVSSTAQSAATAEVDADEFPAKQNWPLFPTQKTSRQHEFTPKSGGNCLKDVEYAGKRERFNGTGPGWDCNRTRTTSRGVTMGLSARQHRNSDIMTYPAAKSRHFPKWQRPCAGRWLSRPCLSPSPSLASRRLLDSVPGPVLCHVAVLLVVTSHRGQELVPRGDARRATAQARL